MTASVLIYQDYVHNHGILHRRLTDDVGQRAVAFCDASDIIAGALEGADLFVMPGGADLYFCEKLNGPGNAAIRAWVEQGGTYLGICAGAYYACRSIEWATGTAQCIDGPRELAFYNGVATGPLPELIEDGSIDKSWDGMAHLRYDDGETCIDSSVHYSGGPWFSGDGKAAILANYQRPDGLQPAIVECAVGQGKAVLAGPHIEGDDTSRARALYRHNNSKFDRQRALIYELEKARTGRQAIWSAVLNRCLAKSNRAGFDAKKNTHL